MIRLAVAEILLLSIVVGATADDATLPDTERLEATGDLSEQMRAGFETFLVRETERSVSGRNQFWSRDFNSRDRYEQSIEPNRQRLRKAIGVIDHRLPIRALEFVATREQSAKIAETSQYTVSRVRWPVFDGVFGEGLLLEPKQRVTAQVIALPDADQTPEMLVGLMPGIEPDAQFARLLAQAGCRVVVPVLIDRDDRWSGNPVIGMTNQPHREWIYRQAYTLGRHVIGYEVQKVLSIVDWFWQQNADAGKDATRIGVAGYSEGGLIALYSAALDRRIDVAWVAGYFNRRERLWEEPIYRNVFGLLSEFGDAEIATMIAPRALIVQQAPVPQIDGPPDARQGRRPVAAPGAISMPTSDSVGQEIRRTATLYGRHDGELAWSPVSILQDPDGNGPSNWQRGHAAFMAALGLQQSERQAERLRVLAESTETAGRQQRQVKQLVEYNQRLMRVAHHVRAEFWNDCKPTEVTDWPTATAQKRNVFSTEIVGHIPNETLPFNPRSRKILEHSDWTAYEVMLDVFPDVFAWGYLLLPRDLNAGERRPVVVCQHGLEGRPVDVINQDTESPAYPVYKGFAAELASRGFIVFAPHNFYRGHNEFRRLQRMANPIGKTLFSLTVAQHARILDWLSSLPFVDADRIGFYGLSYGGNTAMRVPALLPGYSAVICSGDFNEWIYKNVTVDHVHSMIFHNVWEVFEFNLANQFNHGDMAALIAPRPFMVERGHDDGVARDEWVAGEYARVRRLYAKLGIPERTEIEFFDGPHTINGVGTYKFLHRHLKWPKR